jgi:hypothetical protein
MNAGPSTDKRLGLRRIFVRYTPQVLGDPKVELVLYVSSASPYSQTARRNCEQLLTRFDRSKVSFEVCDIAEYPDRAKADAVCYTPMLLKQTPPPRTWVIGDLSNETPLIDLLESCGLDLLR